MLIPCAQGDTEDKSCMPALWARGGWWLRAALCVLGNVGQRGGRRAAPLPHVIAMHVLIIYSGVLGTFHHHIPLAAPKGPGSAYISLSFQEQGQRK